VNKMADDFSLTSSLFAHYLFRKQVPLVHAVEKGEISTTLTNTLLELAGLEDTPHVPNSSDLRFRYKYNFWSDVTKISDGIIKNSQRWENRLKEVGPKISDVSVCFCSYCLSLLMLLIGLGILRCLVSNSAIWNVYDGCECSILPRGLQAYL
jgi:hypothetical protein